MGIVTTSIAIDASPEAIFKIMLDVTDYPSWQGGVERIEIEDTDEQGRPRTTRWQVNAMGLRASYSVAYDYPSEYSLEYRLVESEVLTQYDFGCRVTPTGAGTSEVTLSQELAIKWAMPKALLEKNSKKGLNKMLTALKAKTEEAGTS